jgi:hypothetical protein
MGATYRRDKIEDPERMRALAAEYRAIAENTRDRTCRQRLLAVARTYEKIAAEMESVRASAAG